MQRNDEPDEIESGEESGPGNRFARVVLDFDDESGMLMARVEPADEPMEVDLAGLRALVEDAGYGDLSFRPDALAHLLRRIRDREYGEYPLGSRLDAEVSVGVTADRLQALLSTTKAYGGRPATRARFDEAAAAAGLSAESVLTDAVEAALAEPTVTNRVIAQGIAPRSGNDSRAEVLVDLTPETSRPKETGQGRVDHYLVRDFVIVDAGTPVLRRHPATRGVPGGDVLGEPVPARDGKDVPLPRDMPGVRPDAEDETLLVAEYRGHPVVIPGGIRVDKTLVMDDVDLRTGNVDFDGSVLVKGDVTAGVEVAATGDVMVKGSVENASVHAGNDLLVARGITGSESANRGGARSARISAGGQVEAAFVSGVVVESGADVVVKEYLSHCETRAGGQVLVGQRGGRGVIVGGCCHGIRGVACRTAGTVANVPTRIAAGATETLRLAHEEALAHGAALEGRLEQLRSALAGMVERARAGSQATQAHLLRKLRRTVEDFERRVAEADRQTADLAARIESGAHASVACNGPVHPNVTVVVGTASLVVRREATGGRFTARDDEIHWE
ncbi:MAG: DUF342 domain-containing protein [Pseudomonadota bacterium]